MALEKFTKEQKQAICAYRANNHTIKESIDWLYEEFPDIKDEYSDTTVRLWFSSKEGKKLHNLELERVRSDAKSREYANKESRILALVEVVGKIHSSLREMDPRNDAKFPTLFREFREGLKALREETDDGYGAETARSAFTNMMMELASGPFAWAAKETLPQTREISDN